MFVLHRAFIVCETFPDVFRTMSSEAEWKILGRWSNDRRSSVESGREVPGSHIRSRAG